MTIAVEAAIEHTIGKEGGYSNHPSDTGGATMWGITERVARANGYTGDMRNLPRGKAVEIYRNQYFIRPGFAAVAAKSPKVGAELFDTGVNMGPAYPQLWFQQVLNAMNNGGKLYADILEDGDIGPGTIRAFEAFLKSRGAAQAEVVMLKALNCLQGARYLDLSRGRAANEAFSFGWFQRVEL